MQQDVGVALEVPEGWHNVAHHGSGGACHSTNLSPGGAAQWIPLCRPSGAQIGRVPCPTTAVVGYIVPSLRDFKCYTNILLHGDSGYP